MNEREDAYTRYKNCFPSNEFLLKYFGENGMTASNPQRAKVSAERYAEVRYLFDYTLFCIPIHRLKAMNRAEKEFQPIYVFKDGQPAEWIDPELESGGLMTVLPPEAFLELGKEFILHCLAGAFLDREWWRWRTEESSIWIEVIPEAIAQGKNAPRSLAAILGKTV